MKLRQLAALAAATCLTALLAGCGAPADENAGSGTLSADTPTLEEIYAANTLEAYRQANIQPSLSTCQREGPENTEFNALLTLYWDEELGLVSRFRSTNQSFRYYFSRQDTDYYAAVTEEEETFLMALADDPEGGDAEMTYAERLFRQYGFGEYNSRETMVSCTDCGDTYHIITDISALSFTDSTGRTYTYTTQEYDVEKETLRILDVFRTYQFTDTDGTVKECTRSRCMTYNDRIVSLPDFMQEDVKQADWSRMITLRYPDQSSETVVAPAGIPTLVQAPDGYAAYTDRDAETVYDADAPDEDNVFPDRLIYIAAE
ncbi:MAG TPA: hypothetical protein IAA32_03080 [Candidatus Butyricicoccus stercorigallinarum]|nr:hypothetical protein [Candidatus Butyricicoccus stercorigallinarum]